MPTEPLYFLVALIPIALGAWMGWRRGATAEIVQTIAALFATLVALRYWHGLNTVLSDRVSLDPRYLAAGIFVILFAGCWAVTALLLNFRSQPNHPPPASWDRAAGIFFGMATGALAGGALLLFLQLTLPERWQNVGSSPLALSVDKLPSAVFRSVEAHLARVPFESSAHTPLPSPTAGQNTGGRDSDLPWK